MPAKEQFFRQTKSASARAKASSTDRAIYRITDHRGELVKIAVDCIEGGGNVPRDASNLRDVIADLDMERELGAISAVAETVLAKLKALEPGAVEIEFGVELGGELGIPLITKGEAKANFKITLKWSNETARSP
jgi:Trypsin-co-occurring domain 1